MLKTQWNYQVIKYILLENKEEQELLFFFWAY